MQQDQIEKDFKRGMVFSLEDMLVFKGKLDAMNMKMSKEIENAIAVSRKKGEKINSLINGQVKLLSHFEEAISSTANLQIIPSKLK